MHVVTKYFCYCFIITLCKLQSTEYIFHHWMCVSANKMKQTFNHHDEDNTQRLQHTVEAPVHVSKQINWQPNPNPVSGVGCCINTWQWHMCIRQIHAVPVSSASFQLYLQLIQSSAFKRYGLDFICNKCT